MVDLKSLRPAKGAVKEKKRLGRGIGSGLGKTSGRGQKGAGSRTGASVTPGFEGGQMPLARRLPKRGFRNPSRVSYEIVSLARLDRFPANAVVDADALRRERVVRGRGPIKLLSDGEVAKPLTVKVAAVSAKAREKIVAAGGTVEVTKA
ncbi:MAG: 50S ribosomal protein L15 [Deltaproteobacteria bacterium]|nr:50S ribosomal protein L15 [Deltaproteobacteria bacterium]